MALTHHERMKSGKGGNHLLACILVFYLYAYPYPYLYPHSYHFPLLMVIIRIVQVIFTHGYGPSQSLRCDTVSPTCKTKLTPQCGCKVPLNPPLLPPVTLDCATTPGHLDEHSSLYRRSAGHRQYRHSRQFRIVHSRGSTLAPTLILTRTFTLSLT